MSFIESVLARTKLIEKLLTELGGTGNGLFERTKSLPALPKDLILRLRDIAWVRNQLVHSHEYRFGGDELFFLSVCDSVIVRLSTLATTRKGASIPKPQRPIANSQAERPKTTGSTTPPIAAGAAKVAPKFAAPQITAPSSSAGATCVPPPEQRQPSEDTPVATPKEPPPSPSPQPVSPPTKGIGWMPALVAAGLCLILLPFACTRIVKKGIWPFRSIEKVADWKQVALWTTVVFLLTLFITRRSTGKKP